MALFTISEVTAAKPPNSPISTGNYWDGILAVADRKVKSICRRTMESASYSDVGYTLPVDNPDGTTVYAWYLSEPTGSAIAFGSFTSFTMDDVTVATTDVTIEAYRLIFDAPGEVKVTYPGGFMRDTTGAKVVLLQAVIAVMHILHRQLQGETADFSAVENMLLPYTALLMDGGYAEEPE